MKRTLDRSSQSEEQSSSTQMEDKRHAGKGQGHVKYHDNNPCLQEHNISLKCLADNFGRKKKCELEFENYSECKKFWGALTTERRQKGIYPYLPSYEERQEILKSKFGT